MSNANPSEAQAEDAAAEQHPRDQPFPGSREAAMVVIKRDDNGTPTVWCDPEVTDLVAALNAGGVATIASCSGHGVRTGIVVLADGRELVIVPDFEAGRRLEQITRNYQRGDVEGIQPDVIVSPEPAGREAVAHWAIPAAEDLRSLIDVMPTGLTTTGPAHLLWMLDQMRDGMSATS